MHVSKGLHLSGGKIQKMRSVVTKERSYHTLGPQVLHYQVFYMTVDLIGILSHSNASRNLQDA